MRYRKSSSKIKCEHHTIEGLQKLLGKIESWDEIKSIIPGEIRTTKSSRSLSLEVKRDTQTGVKCLARSGSAVQEVFIVTSDPEAFRQRFKNFLQKS